MTKQELMQKILELWEKNPSFRFCQFIECVRSGEDPFYWTDEVLIKKMEEFTIKHMQVGR